MESSEATVLSRKQQKRSLAAKKKKLGRVLFASPYNNYWPELNETEEESFNELLLRTLKPLRKPGDKVTWSMLQNVPSKERKEFRRKQQMSNCDVKLLEEADKLRECLHLGVNAVTRGLSSSQVSAVLLAKDADPRMLISHILTMCSIQGVPVLVVPALRTVSYTALGFSCLALAIKKNAMNNFQKLCEVVALHSAKIPVPEPLPSYQNALSRESDDEDVDKIKEPVKSESKVIDISTDLYKYRTSKKTRAFVPGRATAPASKSNVDFLAFGPIVEDRMPDIEFKPLRLKRMPPNEDKIKRKELNKRRKQQM